MRKVPLEYVRDGHFTARAIYTDSGQLLIGDKVKLTEAYIEKLRKAGYCSLYILDEFCEKEIEDVIKPKILSQLNEVSQSMSKIVATVGTMKPNIKSKENVNKCVEGFSYLIEEILQDLMNNKEVINNLVSVSVYDDYTFKHSLNIMALTVAIGNAMSFNMDQLKKLAMGSMFHDIGKLFVPLEILNKNGKLTAEEFEIIKSHPQKGFEFLRDYSDLPPTIRILALDHHEKWDGSGYPFKKRGDDIHKMGRICAVCDVFEALIADRPYRRALPTSEAREYILGGGGGHFDMGVVQTFANTINPFPMDSRVKLSDGREGTIYRVNEKFFTRPTVKIYCEEGQQVSPYECDLMQYHNVVITDIIHEFTFEKQE